MNERRVDFEWLRAFARAGDQQALAQVVRRHLDLVFGTALRKVEDAGAAEEIAQNVFTALARKAWQFAPDDSLPAWLHKTTLRESQAWLRGELRRRRREQTAAELGTTMKTLDEPPAFRALVPLLDEALLSLREKDRTALLLRFYERQSLRDVGAAFGVNEDTAQKRVASAVEELSQFFQRRGFRTATIAAALAALQQTSATAPAFMAASVAQAAIHTAPALTGAAVLIAPLLALTKSQKALLCAALLAVPAGWQWHERHVAETESRRQAETAAVAEQENPSRAEARRREPVSPQENPAQPETPRATVAASGILRQEKEYSVHLRGVIALPDFKAAVLQIHHHSFQRSNGPPLIERTILVEGQTFEDRSIKGAYVRFELVQVNADSWNVKLRENNEEAVHELEGRDAIQLPPEQANICLVNSDFEEFLDFYGAVMGRTVLCHPQVKRGPVFIATAAKDRMAAAGVLERTLQATAMTATILDGNRFALLVPTNLVKSVSAELSDMIYPTPTGEMLPPGTIDLRNFSLSQALPFYGALIGRKPVQNNLLPDSLISFRTQTPLSKAEAVYAFDILFRWQGWKCVVVDDRTFKVIRISRP